MPNRYPNLDIEMAYQMEMCGDLDTPIGAAHRIAAEILATANSYEDLDFDIQIDNYTPNQIDELIEELERLL